MSADPPWLAAARRDIGLRELPGAPTAPRIARWLQDLGAWWRDDETPWCGTAVAAWMRAADRPIPKAWYRARAWAEWGQAIAAPLPGCVVVLARQGGGHVGLVVGRNAAGWLLVLGGNQGNAVNVAAFDPSRVLAYRWPPGVQIPPPTKLALGTAAASTSEA
jgi:uncharacterized protein (TIGR02594 family)